MIQTIYIDDFEYTITDEEEVVNYIEGLLGFVIIENLTVN
jgi:hypothetical protein